MNCVGVLPRCYYLNSQDANVTASLQNDAGKVLGACLYNTSLVDAFNLRGQLNFSQSIKAFFIKCFFSMG